MTEFKMDPVNSKKLDDITTKLRRRFVAFLCICVFLILIVVEKK
jgi:hypothetical protein